VSCLGGADAGLIARRKLLARCEIILTRPDMSQVIHFDVQRGSQMVQLDVTPDKTSKGDGIIGVKLAANIEKVPFRFQPPSSKKHVIPPLFVLLLFLPRRPSSSAH
jgi:hypothetical protein